MQTIIGLVAGGLGVSIVPASMQTMGRKDVVFRTLSPKAPRVETFLVWSETEATGALASFIEAARQLV